MVSGRVSKTPATRDEGTSPRRADAERNIRMIIAVGLDLFSSNASVSMVDIARTAGIGRVTLYSHFPSKADLLQELVKHAIAQTEKVTSDALSNPDIPADQSLGRLIGSAWPILNQYRRLRIHALVELGPELLHDHHDPVRATFERLIRRGRRQGRFRSDLPIGWMVATIYGMIHTAADEADTGRLSPDAAPDLLTTTLLRAFARK